MTTTAWHPVARTERYQTLDVIRGVSLFGVLMVNLLGAFRVSLPEHMLTFHTHPGWANRLVDMLAAGLLEFKAFTLFSFLFGAGVAIQAERTAARGVNLTRFLVRRFLALLALGLFHVLLIWNGDILALYAVCGFLLVPFLRLPARALAILGAAAIVLPSVVPLGFPWPSQDALHAQAVRATQVYAQGGFVEIMKFRWHETGPFIVPLLLASLPRTAGLMLCGAAAWRWDLLREPERYRRLLWAVFLGAGAFGATAAAAEVLSHSSGRPSGFPSLLLDLGSPIPLAAAYAAGLLLWLSSTRTPTLATPFAAAGQVALTNYLAQSIVLGFIFYGYGLGLFGRLGPAAAALIGIALYAAQLAFSRMWLRHYRFGPFEWLWRSMTYGRWQPMRHAESTKDASGLLSS